MKNPGSLPRPLEDENLPEEYYRKRVREFGRQYKKFNWPSVEVLLNLLLAYDMVWSRFAKLMAGFNLSPAVFNVLMILSRNTGKKLKQHDVSKLLLVSRANVTGLMNGLVRKGLATRRIDKEDRRAWLVEISGKGKALLESYLPAHYVEIDRIFSDFSVGEKKQLSDLLHKLKNGIR